MNKVYKLGIDIGTTKVVAVLAKSNPKLNTGVEIIDIETSPIPEGAINKGQTVNIAKMSEVILQIINIIKEKVPQIEDLSNISVSVGVSWSQINIKEYTTYIDRIRREDFITYSDLQELQNKVDRALSIEGQKVIQAIPQKYKIDDIPVFADVIGMNGARLECTFMVITGSQMYLNKIVDCIKHCGLRVDKFVMESIASSYAVLKESEMQSGVAILDIGGGTTDLSIFNKGILQYTKVIENGGKYIDNRLQSQYPFLTKDEINKIKKVAKLDPTEEDKVGIIEVNGFNPKLQNKSVNAIEVYGVIAESYFDILNGVLEDIEAYVKEKNKGVDIMGVVLTGGGSNIKEIEFFSRGVFLRETRYGSPSEYVRGGMFNSFDKPEYATGIGLVVYEIRKEYEEEQNAVNQLNNLSKKKEEEKVEREKIIRREKEIKEKEKEEKPVEEESKKNKQNFFSRISNWTDDFLKKISNNTEEYKDE